MDTSKAANSELAGLKPAANNGAKEAAQPLARPDQDLNANHLQGGVTDELLPLARVCA